MNWSLIFTIILGSSVIATLVSKIFDWLREKRRREEEQYQKLYAPLRFYLLMMKSNKISRKELREKMKKRHQELKNGSSEVLDRMNLRLQPKINLLTKEWWQYLEKIKELLETNSQYIKKEHLIIVYKFIRAYIIREQMYGLYEYHDTYDLFAGEDIEKSCDEFYKALDDLEKEIMENKIN